MAANQCPVGKPFLTYKQQIDKLMNEKGLIVVDESEAIELLKRYSYFDLISGYKKPFKASSGQYKAHTTINDIYALYAFDTSFRAVMLKRILVVEKHIKSLLSYSFCGTFSNAQAAYLNATNYNYIPRNRDGINQLISELKKIIDHPKRYPYLLHQQKKYQNTPLWVIAKALTMGKISVMYSYLQPSIQSRISHEFSYVNESDLMRMLDMLSRVRNVCAHNERLYDYRYKQGAINDSYVHAALKLPKKAQYTKGKSDLFAVMIIMKYLLDPHEFSSLIRDIQALFDDLFHSTGQLQKAQIEKAMGFPDNWRDIEGAELK